MIPDVDSPLLWEFAQDSAQEVAAIAARLSMIESQDPRKNDRKRQVVQRLGTLAAYLLVAYFDRSRYDLHREDTSSKKLGRFLEGLERLCTWPRDLPSPRGNDLSDQFPTLSSLLENEPRRPWELDPIPGVQASLKAFVSSDEAMIKRYFSFLKRFSSTEKDSKKHAEANQTFQTDISGKSAATLEPPNDYPAHVHEAFYKIMKKYTQCCCSTVSGIGSGFSGRHEGKLRLKENFETREDHVLFDIVLSRIPSEDSYHEVEWQHLQFHVSRTQAGLKGVQFVLNEASTQKTVKVASKSQYAGTIKSNNQFCELVRRRVGPAKLRLKVKGERLLQFRDLEGIDDDIAHERTVSLEDVLSRHNVVAKKKLLLAYILARSFWQFYNSDWMCAPWTTESVQFFRERKDEDNQDGDISVLEASPYFAFAFQQDDDSLVSAEHLASGCVVHRYPRVLALASILYEIGRGKRQRSATSKKKRHFRTPEERISYDFNDIRKALGRKSWPDLGLQEEARQTYKLVVENCSNPRLFESLESSSVQEEGVVTIEERRAILYKEVVYPLQTLLQKLNWIDKAGNIHRQDDEELSIADYGPEENVPRNTVAFLNTQQASDSRQTGSMSEQWLRKVQDSPVTRDLILGFTRSPAPKRIRIAVLDTGYDPEAIMFKTPKRKRRIQKWKDYVIEDSTTRRDEDGHGTHVLSLVMKVAPAADIYVARVARDTEGLAHSTKNISEAITWAAQECEADIISMSFGFDEELPVEGDRVMSNAISNSLVSRKQQILFFAAAANEGGNQSEMFPASHPQVISIRGTDEKGWLQRFNPPPGDNSTCFMTLGQDVPGASRSQDGGAEVFGEKIWRMGELQALDDSWNVKHVQDYVHEDATRVLLSIG
ncbi:hypothetical protein CEP51_011412 [Fusarium floridanum]|uniref:Uncharacterized protein n=1 Tax=Fusarium floridanum TaxID=1325733 RepID=A0A428RBE4_9HYPO|nr:hypothetical protein CEP51_011412 [Fusarium floridanum]